MKCPAFEDGTYRWFRNVGKQKSDAGDTPKRLLTISFLVFLVYILLNSNMIGNWKIRQDLEECVHCLIQLLHQNLPTGTSESFDD
jgi:hypothetical protein